MRIIRAPLYLLEKISLDSALLDIVLDPAGEVRNRVSVYYTLINITDASVDF